MIAEESQQRKGYAREAARYVRVCTCVNCVLLCVYINLYKHKHICIHACIKHTYIHIYMHTDIHTCINTHIQTYDGVWMALPRCTQISSQNTRRQHSVHRDVQVVEFHAGDLGCVCLCACVCMFVCVYVCVKKKADRERYPHKRTHKRRTGILLPSNQQHSQSLLFHNEIHMHAYMHEYTHAYIYIYIYIYIYTNTGKVLCGFQASDFVMDAREHGATSCPCT
jgi:hypothetical protein